MKALPSDPPLFQIFPLEDGRGLRLVGELDLSTVDELRMMLDAFTEDGQGVTLDLADLSFMDSTGVHLFEQHASTCDRTRPLVLDHVPRHIRRLFEITGMHANPRIELRSDADHV